MSTQASLSSTIAYLRFPLRGEHCGGLCDGSRCPHCPGTRIQKWGRFGGRQRFRCRDCRRTFSTFTGTPLRYLKRPQSWGAFLWCMDGRLTVRRSGAIAGIDKNTALRWRHRVLDHWRLMPHRRLRGAIAVGEFWMPVNEKGSRRLTRRARRHGHAPGRAMAGLARIGLLAAIETDCGGTDQWIGISDVRVLGQADYASLLGPRIGHAVEIVGDRGPLCPLASFVRGRNVAYRWERSQGNASVSRLRLELRRWLSPLRGVATHRLDNYLEWFRRGGPMFPGPKAGNDAVATNSSRRQSQREPEPTRDPTPRPSRPACAPARTCTASLTCPDASGRSACRDGSDRH